MLRPERRITVDENSSPFHKCAVYMRYSSERGHSRSLAAQLRICREAAAAMESKIVGQATGGSRSNTEPGFKSMDQRGRA